MAKIEIYSKDHCPYCVKAKMLLQQLGIEFEEIDTSKNPDRVQELLARRPSARTFPQIFINGDGIGGCDDLYALHQDGKLMELLEVRG